jgi:hypothetical protein
VGFGGAGLAVSVTVAKTSRADVDLLGHSVSHFLTPTGCGPRRAPAGLHGAGSLGSIPSARCKALAEWLRGPGQVEPRY